MKRMCSIMLAAVFLLVCLFQLAGCSKNKQTDAKTLSDYNNKNVTIAVEVGSITEENARAVCPDAKYIYVADVTSGYLAVQSGQADAYAGIQKSFVCAEESGLTGLQAFPEIVGEKGNVAAGISPKSSLLNPEGFINDFIAQMEEQGVLEEMQKRWAEELDYTMPQIEAPAKPDKTIKIATTGLIEPYTFYEGTTLTGYDLELIKRFALWANAEIEISTYDWSGIITACASGQVDYILSNLMDTPERRESIGFSKPYREIETVLIIKETDEALGAAGYDDVTDLYGKRIGVPTGTVFDELTDQFIENAEKSFYNGYTDLTQALKSKKIDAFLCDMPVGISIQNANPDLNYLPDALMPDKYGYIFAKTEKGEMLRDQMNEFLAQIKVDGTWQTLNDGWFQAERSELEAIDFSSLSAENGTLKFATNNTMEPFVYTAHNQTTGFDIDLVFRFCQQYGYGLSPQCMDFSSLVGAVQSGKCDMGGSAISITEERAESVLFSDSYYEGGIVAVVRTSGGEKAQSFFASVSDSFHKTFIREDRWKLITAGLTVTLIISIASLAFGTLFGFGVCLVRRSKKKALSRIAAAFIRLVQGVPVVVLLMVLYYIVFASSDISEIFVAIIGFSLNFGVNVAEMMRSGIDAIPAGQWEAASALGYGKLKSFQRVIAPQAIRHVLPAFQGEFINMMKMTSVVGYIAIQDLTKASEIIRSRTYEAFFPLIVISVIYFLLAWGLTALMSLAERGLDPQRRSRRIRGVNTALAEGTHKATEIATGKAGEVISITHLKKAYPNVTPLADISTSIQRGDVVTIIGPSGTGKSTLLRMLNRLEQPTAGKIVVLGQDMGDKKKSVCGIRQRMGMVFQSFNLFPHLTVVENIMLAPTDLKHIPKQTAYETAMALLETVGLAEKAMAYPDELSGGQKQRVAIARALAMQPEILLFDEPTSALDPTMVGEVLTVIRNLSQLGLTMLIVTHEMKFARDVSTRIFYLDEGVIYEEGTPEQIFDAPQKGKTRQFVKRLKCFQYTIRDKRFDFIGLLSGLETFCQKHMLTPTVTNHACSIVEELCVQTILPQLADEFQLSITVEYADDSSEVQIIITYGGEPRDYLQTADPLCLALIRHATQSIVFSNTDAGNRYDITLH